MTAFLKVVRLAVNQWERPRVSFYENRHIVPLGSNVPAALPPWHIEGWGGVGVSDSSLYYCCKGSRWSAGGPAGHLDANLPTAGCDR